MSNLAIYIHWPFCKSKCPYCDFNSHIREKIDQEKWEESYLAEINYFKEEITNKNITSIFFGGGTPSLMDPKTTERIISHLAKIGSFDKKIEITLEANPTSIESQKFKDFKNAGINRVSIGIQSFDEASLHFLGRTHSPYESINAIKIADSIFNNYSFDLIYARPNQTTKEWKKELTYALNFAKNHISLYQLTIEKGTEFYKKYKNKEFIMPNEILSSSLYELTEEITTKHGLIGYEISNYAKEGYESKHNLSYWNYDNYLGIGPGAHSRINGKALMIMHNPEKWLENIQKNGQAIQSNVNLLEQEIFEEFLLMSLRTKYGLNKSKFKKLLKKDITDYISLNKLNILIKENLLNNTSTHIFTTEKGRILLNKIIEFLV